jgi:hypothetical protein
LESLSVACAVASYFTLGRAGWLARLYFRLTGVATREEAEVTFIRFITAIIAVFITVSAAFCNNSQIFTDSFQIKPFY